MQTDTTAVVTEVYTYSS